ncbi:MAG: glutathione S-transferase N-terminal domain-containing protein [Pseudomonadota bacterium]
MELILYYAPFACASAPFILLGETGADFEVRPVNLGKGQHTTPEYLAPNPKRKVPVLVIDGEPLTENVAIQIWIARNFPNAKLLPADPLQEIRAISLLAWCASGIHPAITPVGRPERFCDLPGSEDSVRRCSTKLLMDHYQLADDMLAGREWFFDHFTAPDAYFFWCFRRGTQLGLDLSGFKNCQAHMARMVQRPSVQKMLAYEAQVMEQFAKAA